MSHSQFMFLVGAVLVLIANDGRPPQIESWWEFFAGLSSLVLAVMGMALMFTMAYRLWVAGV